MSVATDTATELEDQIFDAAKFAQQAVLDGVRAWADVVKKVVPVDSLPFADQLPSPTDAIGTVDKAYALAERVIANQKQFAHDLLAAVTA